MTSLAFSEAMRLGAMLKPQMFGAMFRRQTDIAAPGDVLGLRRLPDASCAVGGALDAVGLQRAFREMDAGEFKALVDLWPVLFKPAMCPACGISGAVVNIAMHLNDHHRWTRERTADWVATIEARPAQFLAIETEVLAR